MTYHSSMQWDWGQEVTEEVIDEIVRGCRENRAFMYNMQFTPSAYGLFGALDPLILNACVALDKKKSEEGLRKMTESAPDSEKAFEILSRVVSIISSN